MDLRTFILLGIIAVMCVVLIFVLVKLLKNENKDDKIAKLQKQKDDAIAALELRLRDEDNTFGLQRQKDDTITALELKLQDAINAKSTISLELTSCKKQINGLQQQLAKALEGNVDKETLDQPSDSSQLREQIAKLEKKIKDLEDETEEYEEEIGGLKKEIKKKKTEVEELEGQLRQSKKQNEELETQVADKNEELQITNENLSLKNESLSFVQEVLQAEKASDGNEIEAAVNSLAEFIKGDMADVLKETSNLRIDESELLNWSISAKKTWLKNKTTIAFVGEFSAGKTSIVNRILSQGNKNIPLLPVSAKATTAIPTYISGGVATVYQFYSPDNILKKISESTFKRVTKEVLSQVEGLSALIKYFVMKYKNPNLDRLSILDTPGFNSNDSEDSRRTIEVINECDALFWVFDVNAGTVNRSSLKVIKKNLKKPLYIVINKVDTKSDKEVDSVEALIRKTIEAEGIEVKQYIRFSSNQKYDLDSIMVPIHNVVHDTAKDEYISDWGNSLISLQKEWQEYYKESNSSYNANLKKHENVVNRYINAQHQLYQSCVEAANIPHFESHFIRSDKYEMSVDEYNQLDSVLENIATDQCERLANLFDESNDIISEINNSYIQKSEAEQSLTKIDQIINKFEKLNANYIKVLTGSHS